MEGDPPASSSSDKRRGWAAAKTFLRNSSSLGPPPRANDSTLAVPGSSSSPSTSPTSYRSSALNLSATSRASEDSTVSPGEESIRLVRRSMVSKRQSSGTSMVSSRRVSRAGGPAGGHLPRSATEELARQLDGDLAQESDAERPSVEELPQLQEQSESPPRMASPKPDSDDNLTSGPASQPPPTHQLSPPVMFDSPTADVSSPSAAPAAYPFPIPSPPVAPSPRTSLLKSPTPSKTASSKQRLTLPPLDTNTVYLPAPSGGGLSPLPSPSQAHWKSVRDVVVGPSSASGGNSPVPTSGVQPASAVSKKSFKESYPPERARTGEQPHPNGDDREGGFFRKGFAGGFRSVADQAIQLAAGTRERERGRAMATDATSAGPATDGHVRLDEKAGPSTRQPKKHPQYARFEAEMSAALTEERRNRLLGIVSAPGLASVLGIPLLAADGTNSYSHGSHSSSTRQAGSSYPTHGSSRSHPSSVPAGPNAPSSSSRNSTLFSANPSETSPLSALLRVLHVYVPYATQSWAQPLPCESEVLVELGRPFASEGTPGGGMSLEVFTLIAKNWRSGTREQEGERWAWCLKAIQVGDDSIRARALPLLISLLAPTASSAPIPTHPLSQPPTSPLALQTLLVSLIGLDRALLSSSSGMRQFPTRSNTGGGARVLAQQAESGPGTKEAISRLVGKVRRGEVITLDKDAVKEAYSTQQGLRGGVIGEGWDARRVSEAVAWEGVVLAHASAGSADRRAMLRGEITTFWPELFASELDTITALVHRRGLLAFLRASRSFLIETCREQSEEESGRDRLAILDLLRDRVLPQLETLGSSSSGSGIEDLQATTMGVLVVLCLEGQSSDPAGGATAEIKEEGAAVGAWALLEDLWKEDGPGWRAALTSSLINTIASEDSSVIESAVLHFVGRDAISTAIVKSIVPALFERLVHLPSSARVSLLPLLLNIRSTHPQLFYRPLFACATSDKFDTVLHNQTLLGMLAEVLGPASFWLYDSEMLAMACGGGAKATSGDGKLGWGKMKLGQMIVLADLTKAVEAITQDLEAQDEQESTALSQFFDAFEARLAVLIDARERTSLLPLSHRSLLASLLFRTRSLTRSLRRAPWLSRVVAWALEAHVGASARPAPLPVSPSSPGANPFLEPALLISVDMLMVDEMVLGELALSFHRLRTAQEPVADVSARSKAAKRATTTLMDLVSPTMARPVSLRPQPVRSSTSASNLQSPLKAEDVEHPILSLLVAVFSLLSMQDLSSLGPVIYRHHLDRKWDRLGPAVFLLSLAAERTPASLSAAIVADIDSSDAHLHLAVLARLSALFSWRTRILSEPYIPDRHRRRPFKTVKEVLSFVPTDCGVAAYVPLVAQESEASLLKFGASLPLSVRTRLATLGWDTDENEESSRSDWERMPVSLLSEALVVGSAEDGPVIAPPAKQSNPDRPTRTLARRRSATYETPVQPPVVPSLIVSTLGRQLVNVLEHCTGQPASAGREVLLTVGREDASLVIRPILGQLTFNGSTNDDILSRLRVMLSAQHNLPPALSHYAFSHLAGFLKGLAKAGHPSSLDTYSLVLPLMADLAPQVNELSIRELRRNKVDLLCLPTGAFWFDETAPRSPMFPRQLAATDEDGSSTGLHEMIAIRSAQNMILLSILRRDRKEAYSIKKTVSTFLLPRVLRGGSRASRTYVPEPQSSPSGDSTWSGPTGSRDTQRASRLLSRSWLLVVQQVLACLNRNYADRVELAHTLEGVNEILTAHWDALDIVGHALQIYMTASTRFRRLFNSVSAFALVLPPIFFAYAQAESIPAIRDAIEYTFRRFFNIHQESMVFQTIAAISTTVLHREIKDDDHRRWISGHLFRLLRSLDGDAPGVAGRAVGIRGGNEVFEREALISLVNDAPEIILSELRTSSCTEEDVAAVVATKWEERHFPLSDVIRLMLTVIAHDPSSSRAESFLRTLRHVAVDFIGAGPAGQILPEGIEALGLMVKKSAPKAPNRASSKATGEAVVSWNELDYSLLPGQSREIEWTSMRCDYLWLVQAFVAGGGSLSTSAMKVALGLVPGLLKEAGSAAAEPAAAFLGEYVRTSAVSRETVSAKEAVTVLKELSPLVRSYADLVDFSAVLGAIADLVQSPDLRSDRAFASIVLNDFILPSIQTCAMAAAEGSIFSLPIRMATVNLIICSTSVDAVALLVREPATPAFLAGVVLPVSVAFGSFRQDSQSTQDAQSRAFHRLLQYAIASCDSPASAEDPPRERTRSGKRSPSPSPGPSPSRNVLSKLMRPGSESRGRTKSGESTPGGTTSGAQASAATVVLAVQIVKAILVQASDKLDRDSGIWELLGDFVRTLFDSVDARFLHAGPRGPSFDHNTSASSSRSGSPTPRRPGRDRSFSVVSETSGYTGLLTPTYTPSSALPTSIDFAHNNSPSALDAVAWSLMEMLVSFPCPLLPLLRPWIGSKIDKDVRLVAADPTGQTLRPSSAIESPATAGSFSALLDLAMSASKTMVRSTDLAERTVQAVRRVERAFGVTQDEVGRAAGEKQQDKEWTKTGALGRIADESKIWIFGGEFGDLFDGGSRGQRRDSL